MGLSTCRSIHRSGERDLETAQRPDPVGPEFQRRVLALQQIQSDLNIADGSLVEYALRFCLSEPGVSTVRPGASRLEQSRRYAACGDAELLPAQELAKVKAVVTARMSGAGGAFQLR